MHPEASSVQVNGDSQGGEDGRPGEARLRAQSRFKEGAGHGHKRRRPRHPPRRGAGSKREVERDGVEAAVTGGDLPSGPDFWGQTFRADTFALPFPGSDLGKFLHLSEPQFSHLENEVSI